MPQPSPDPPTASPSLTSQAMKAVGEMASSVRPSKPPSGDLLDTLRDEEERVLRKHWPDGRPAGDGVDYFNRAMQIRVRRLAWKSRIETGGEIAWLLGKLGGVFVVLAFAWEHCLG